MASAAARARMRIAGAFRRRIVGMLPGATLGRRPIIRRTREAAPEGRLSGVRTDRSAYSAQSAYAVTVQLLAVLTNSTASTVQTVEDEA
jgi:hypothetical protein